MSDYLHESSRNIPVVADTDVVVCGGGPAGVAAALSAARAGARVTLIEAQGCLGGVWTSGLLTYVIDGDAEGGVMADILRRIGELQGHPAQACATPAAPDRPRRGITYQAEVMKLALESLCREAGVVIRLHTRVVAAVRDDGDHLGLIVTESKSGREAWRGGVFVDCTGDGDLAAQACCGFEIGRPGDGAMQPMSLMAVLSGLKLDEVARFVVGGRQDHASGKGALLAELRAAEHEPSYGQPSLFHIHGELFALMVNHAYGFSGLDAARVTEATLRSREEVFFAVRALRSRGGPWRNVELVATGAHIGVREGRRIRGLYTVTREDLIRGASHDDAVCHVTFPVDVHAPAAEGGKGYSDGGVRARPYDIPLRALIARDVDGLLLAGRCISGDFFAHASYRVTGYAVELGTAAGRAAAWCAHAGVPTRSARWSAAEGVFFPASAIEPVPAPAIAGVGFR